MNYWLVAHKHHSSETTAWMQSHSWDIVIESDYFNNNLNNGDILYIVEGDKGIYAWGYLKEIKEHASQKQFSITIGRGEIYNYLINSENIKREEKLRDLLNFPYGKFNFLTNLQIRAINNLIPLQFSKPPLPNKPKFIFNKSADKDEDLHTEYKDTKFNNIPNEAYEFAVAFLKQSGGSIYFGIQDKDYKIVGIKLNSNQRDEIKNKIENKLYSISPTIYPSRDYFLELHPVIDEQGNYLENLFVLELEVKSKSSIDYKTKGGKSYIKSYSGRKILKD